MQEPALRGRLLAYINSIVTSRLPRVLADHLRDGMARSVAVAEHLRDLAAKAGSPADTLALQDAAQGVAEGLVPIYASSTRERLVAQHASVDDRIAENICAYLSDPRANKRVAEVTAEAWPVVTDDTRCEPPNEEGEYPNRLAYSAGKGGERRVYNDVERGFLEQNAHLLMQFPTDLSASDTAGQLKHIIGLLDADLHNITLVPPPTRAAFADDVDGTTQYERAIQVRQAIVVQAYLTHLHLIGYCIIGTRKSHQACKGRYARQECDTAEQDRLARDDMLTELRNHGASVKTTM